MDCFLIWFMSESIIVLIMIRVLRFVWCWLCIIFTRIWSRNFHFLTVVNQVIAAADIVFLLVFALTNSKCLVPYWPVIFTGRSPCASGCKICKWPFDWCGEALPLATQSRYCICHSVCYLAILWGRPMQFCSAVQFWVFRIRHTNSDFESPHRF